MTQSRLEFSFQELARKSLDFLLESGFTCVGASDFRVRYESAEVFIELTRGQRDGEVALFFGRPTFNERFCFALFLKLVNPELEKQMGPRIGDTPEKVAALVSLLASALESQGKPIIGGDTSVFDRMKSVRWWDFNPEMVKRTT